MTTLLGTKSNLKISPTWTIVQTRLIVIGIRVGAGASLMNEVDVLRVDNGPSPAVLWGDWRRRAAQVKAGLFAFRAAQAKGRRVIPFFARSEARDCAAIFYYAQVAHVRFAGWAAVKGESAVRGDAGAATPIGNDLRSKTVPIHQTNIIPNIIGIASGRKKELNFSIGRWITPGRPTGIRTLANLAVLSAPIASSLWPKPSTPTRVWDLVNVVRAV